MLHDTRCEMYNFGLTSCSVKYGVPALSYLSRFKFNDGKIYSKFCSSSIFDVLDCYIRDVSIDPIWPNLLYRRSMD